MNHLTDAEFSDYARGITAPEKFARAQEHISQCARCKETKAFYERLMKVAFATTSTVPAELVAWAKGVFQANDWRATQLVPILGRRILPQNNEWALLGVRSALHSGAAKHAVYECGDFHVDLRSEKQPDTIRVSLVGQLANQNEPGRVFDAVQVRLVAGKKTLERTECNHLGEFALSFAPARRLHLEIEVPDQPALLTVPLGELNPEETRL